jgi:hypothetical protein
MDGRSRRRIGRAAYRTVRPWGECGRVADDASVSCVALVRHLPDVSNTAGGSLLTHDDLNAPHVDAMTTIRFAVDRLVVESFAPFDPVGQADAASSDRIVPLSPTSRWR